MKKLVLVAMLFSSINCYSWSYEGGSFAVSKLRFGEGGLHLALSPAPNACGGGDQFRMHFRVNPESEFYEDMVAGLLAANATGQRLQFVWFNNQGVCSSTHVLLLEMFEYSAK